MFAHTSDLFCIVVKFFSNVSGLICILRITPNHVVFIIFSCALIICKIILTVFSFLEKYEWCQKSPPHCNEVKQLLVLLVEECRVFFPPLNSRWRQQKRSSMYNMCCYCTSMKWLKIKVKHLISYIRCVSTSKGVHTRTFWRSCPFLHIERIVWRAGNVLCTTWGRLVATFSMTSRVHGWATPPPPPPPYLIKYSS